MAVLKHVITLAALLGAIAVRDSADKDEKAEPHALEHAKPVNPLYQHDASSEIHKLQEAIPTEMRESHTAPFAPIDWFKPTHGELKFGDKISSVEKGALAEGVEMVGATAAQMQTWAAEAGHAMNKEQAEYEKFKRDIDEQAARADTLHSQMKWEIMKKDKIRMHLLDRAAQFDSDGLHFHEDNISAKNWHKDEPEHLYTLKELGLEDAQEAGELAEREVSDVNSSLENTSSSVVGVKDEYQNVWDKILNKKETSGTAANRAAVNMDPSPFTAVGQAARTLAEEQAKKSLCRDESPGWCADQRSHCKDISPYVFEHCRRTCNGCTEEELQKAIEEDKLEGRLPGSSFQSYPRQRMDDNLSFGDSQEEYYDQDFQDNSTEQFSGGQPLESEEDDWQLFP